MDLTAEFASREPARASVHPVDEAEDPAVGLKAPTVVDVGAEEVAVTKGGDGDFGDLDSIERRPDRGVGDGQRPQRRPGRPGDGIGVHRGISP